MPMNVPLEPRHLSGTTRMMVAATLRRARQTLTGTDTSGPDAAATAGAYVVLDGVEVYVTVTVRGPACETNLPGLPFRRPVEGSAPAPTLGGDR